MLEVCQQAMDGMLHSEVTAKRPHKKIQQFKFQNSNHERHPKNLSHVGRTRANNWHDWMPEGFNRQHGRPRRQRWDEIDTYEIDGGLHTIKTCGGKRGRPLGLQWDKNVNIIIIKQYS